MRMKLIRSRQAMQAGLIIYLILFNTTVFADDFPGRKLYLDVPYIELSDLNKAYDDSIIVDVRSAYEYSTLHIKDALNIPLTSTDFVKTMRELRNKHPTSRIVTYCNGKTCMKSYKAARKCKHFNIKNVVAFDAGIMDWTQAFPEKSVLLGVTPVDPKKLISKKRFEAHLLGPEQFISRSGKNSPVIVDIRDAQQREGVSLFLHKEFRVGLDDHNKLDKYIRKAKSANKPLLIYDEAGKQVRWLMYYIEDKKVTEYYFMKGGIKHYLKTLRENFVRDNS